jgi:hypothetical protein
MDYMVKVEGGGSASLIRSARMALRVVALATLAAAVTACGGGGGGGDGGNTETGSLRVTVTDTFGASVQDASVQATVGSSTRSGMTDAGGVVLLNSVAVGSASVVVSRATFVSQTVSASINASQTTELAVELVRQTSAAGGSLATRDPAGGPVIGGGGQTLTFQIELVVVGSDSQAIETLTAADFVLRPCPTDSTTPRPECLIDGTDVGYNPTTPTAQSAILVPGGTPQPYAAGLLLDQSGSIDDTDPTGARLFSAKAFLEGLGSGDRVLLAAFAEDVGTTLARIPDKPLTVYPPFRDAGTISDPPSYFDTLDSFFDLVGGGTPLYDALDLLRGRVVADSTLPAGIAKAIVIFTDGHDQGPECDDIPAPTPSACRTRRNESIQNAGGVRFFTIGLSTGIDFEAMAELANQTGGAFLFAENAEQLIPLYGTVGDLLSLSLPTYRLSFTVDAGTTGVYQPGRALLGRVTVNAGTDSFDVPFIVGIP